MKINWRTEAIPVILIAGMFILSAFVWPEAPDRIPTHWNASGEADSYSGKFLGLFMLPLISLSLYPLFFILPKIDPRRGNYMLFWSKYILIRTIIITVFAAIHVFVCLWALDHEVNMATAMTMIIGFLFIFLGNYMGKVRPNWFVGIRTPWTLSSEESWNKTHRLGGWAFVLSGLALIITGIINADLAIYAVYGSVGAILVIPIVYSYLVWRKDPSTNSTKTRWADQ